jgi:hypothetical protein
MPIVLWLLLGLCTSTDPSTPIKTVEIFDTEEEAVAAYAKTAEDHRTECAYAVFKALPEVSNESEPIPMVIPAPAETPVE